eukprot:COSAG02_NODE_108_length_36286_cov_19.437478_32_plen_89_part_00
MIFAQMVGLLAVLALLPGACSLRLETVIKRGVLGSIKRYCSIIWYGSPLYELLYKSPLRWPRPATEVGCIYTGNSDAQDFRRRAYHTC